MQTSSNAKFLWLFIPVAALSACGGGGGGDVPSQPVVNPGPAPAETGLAAPTRTVKREQHLGLPMVNEVLVSYNRAAGAAALKAAGRMAPGLAQAGTSPMACAGGGNISWTNSTAGEFAYSYNACQDSGYTFNGNSTASAGAAGSGWQQSYSALQVGGLADPLVGTVSCSPASPGAAARCLVSHRAYTWGFDARFEGGKANGTHRADGDSWNVTFSDYTTTAGTALISAANGIAGVTHGSGEQNFTVSVTLSIDGVTSTYNVNCPQAPDACPSPF